MQSLGTQRVRARRSFTLCILLALSPLLAQHASPRFACEVRYHFREQFRDAKLGQKNFSAPSSEREALPVSRVFRSNGSTERIVEGTVAHLPYHFLVKISQSDQVPEETLEINVMDSAGKPLAGFPQSMPNPVSKRGDSTRKEFEIPISESIRQNIERTLLKKNQLLTSVSLTIGVDDDFLSRSFPKAR